jgi:hypothetical protein
MVLVEEGFVIRLAKRWRSDSQTADGTLAWLTSFEGKPLRLPKGFSPDSELPRKHAVLAIGNSAPFVATEAK